MSKLKKHFTENAAIYLVLITCLIIFSIIFYVNRTSPDEPAEPLNTSLFINENLITALNLFSSDEPIYLVLGVDTCSATRDYVASLNYETIDLDIKFHYLDLNTIKEADEDLEKFIKKLSLEYTLFDETKTFGDFIGNTPMTIIIKDHKQVYGYIGSMSTTAIATLVNTYGIK